MGPVGEMFQGWDVGVVEFERGDGDGAVADRGHVRIRLYALHDLLLVQPEIFAAARVGARLQQVARDF